MMRGIYIGAVKHLRDKTALLQDIPGDIINLKAQFDDMELDEAYGWHRYRREAFTITWTEEQDRKLVADV